MLSVIIPTSESESERALVRTLSPLVAGAAAGLVREAILVGTDPSEIAARVADVAGCRLIVSEASLGTRLSAAAAAARASWLLFLRPGIVLEPAWVDAVAGFVERTDPAQHAAAFYPASDARRPALAMALTALKSALGGRPSPEQGLLIARALYDAVGGHTANVREPEADLIRRLGRRRIALLGCGAHAIA